MDILQIDHESGISTALIDDLDGWNVPLTFEGTYDPEEDCSPLPNTPSSFKIERVYIHAGGGSDTDEDPDYKPVVDPWWFKSGVKEEIEVEIANYIDECKEEPLC